MWLHGRDPGSVERGKHTTEAEQDHPAPADPAGAEHDAQFVGHPDRGEDAAIARAAVGLAAGGDR